MRRRVLRTWMMVLLSAMTGCVSKTPRQVIAPPPLQPEAPHLSQSPLYSPEMSENNPRLPNLPPLTTVAIAPPPPPPPKPHRVRKTKGTVTASQKEGNTPPTNETASNGETSSPAAEKKTVETGKSSSPENAAPAPSPIGDLTAGSSAEAAQTSHQTADLIKTTKDGLGSIRRQLSPDEKKTEEEIREFLKRADIALKNGDVDGAFGLATKAKLLLDELVQK